MAEGCVLLRNEKNTLPVKNGETIAVFGRSQFNYYKSGTGSGGMVNTPYVVSILDALEEDKDNSAAEGSYLLTEKEEAMLEVVCRFFPVLQLF